MRWNLALDFVSLPILIILLIYAHQLTLLPTLKNRMLRICLNYVFFEILFSISAAFLMKYEQAFPLTLVVIVQTISFLTLPMITLLFFEYIIAVTMEGDPKIGRYFRIAAMPYGLYAGHIVSHLLFDWLNLTFAEPYPNFGVILTYLVIVLYVLAMMFLVVFRWRRMGTSASSILLTLPIGALLVLAIQYQFPNMILAGAAATVALLVLYLSTLNTQIVLANKELAFQNREKVKQLEELIHAKGEIELANERIVANLDYTRNLFEISTDPLVVMGRNGTVIDVNTAAEMVTGMPREQLINTDFANYVVDPMAVMEGYPSAFQGKNIVNFEMRLKHVDGSSVPVLCNTSVYRDQTGNVIGLLASARNMSTVNRSKALLEQSIAFQAIVMQIATQFININEDDIDDSIHVALKMVGEFLQTDRAYVYIYHFDEDTMENSSEWCNEGVAATCERRTRIPLSDYQEDWVLPHCSGKRRYVENASQVPQDRKLFSLLMDKSIQSLVTIPMMFQSECLGFVGFESIHTIRRYEENELSLLQVLAEVITNLLVKQRQLRRLAQAKTDILQIKQNYELFFNTIGDFLFVLDEQGSIVHANHTVISRLGYKMEELVGKSVLAIHPAERREEAAQIVDAMLAGSKAFCPVPIETKQGIQIPVETRVTRGFWNDKPVLFGVTKDISALQLSEEKFAKLFHMNPSACGLNELEALKYIEVNEAFYTLLGYSKSEVVGKTAVELGITECEVIEAITKNVNANGSIHNVEIELKTKSGASKVVLLAAETIVIQDAKYIYTVFQDVTDQRRAEKELLEKNKIMHEMDILANLAKNTFIENMSHEIRTPLSGIYNAVYLLDNTELSTDQREYLDIASYSLETLSPIINDVLDLSKIDAGRLVIDNQVVNLESEMVQVAKNWKYVALEKQIDFHFEYDYAIPELVSIDITHLRQILTNLLNNAIKFTEAGSVTFRLSMIEKTPQSVTIDFSVIDTGKGIAAKDIPLLTEKFFQVNSHDSVKTPGTGLGLSIASELIHLMGDQLRVKSQLGVGSEFSFNLHLHTEADAKAEAMDSVDGKRILLVCSTPEDEARERAFFTSLNMVVETLAAHELPDLLKRQHDHDFVVFSAGKSIPSEALLQAAASVVVSKFLLIRNNIDVAIERWGASGIDDHLILPLSRSDLIGKLLAQSEDERQASRNAARTISNGYRLLVVDDNRINRKSMAIILNNAGFMITSARNGFEALDLIRENEFDLLMLDIQMPGMDGYELAKNIRNLGGKYASLPMVALTANAMTTALNEAVNAGMNGAISKPVKPDEMLRLIKFFLKDTPVPDEIDLSAIHIPDNLAVFDPVVLMKRLGDHKELVHDMLSAYLEDYRKDLDMIEAAIAHGNSKAIDDQAHYFVSSAANVCADRLLWLTRMLRIEAKNGVLDSMKPLMVFMRREAERSAATMKDWLQERNKQ